MADKAGQNPNVNRSIELDAPVAGTPRLQLKPLAATVKSPSQPFPNPANSASQQPQARQGKDQAPLSQIANDGLLPEDDMSSFFKNRAVVARNHFGISSGMKCFIAMVISAFVFVGAYNYKRKFAEATDRVADRWLGFYPGNYIPAFGPRSKAKQSFTENLAHQKNTSSQKYFSDPIVTMTRNGQWTQVEQRISGKCVRWDATRDCALKGFYYSHRAMNQMTKPILSISETTAGKLEPQSKALWYLAAALATTDGNGRERRFQQALHALAPKDLEMRRILFDEMITGLYKDRQFNDIPRFMRIVDTEPKANVSRSDLAKWRSLASLSAPSNARVTIYTSALREDRTSFRGDPQILILLTPEMIRSGLAASFSDLVAEANTNATASSVDKELRRGLMQSSIRLKYAQGQRAEYAVLLARYAESLGKDPFSQHYSTVTQLNIGTDDRNQNALEELRGMRPNAPWETWVLYAFALLRTGQPTKIDSMISVLSTRSQPPQIQMWGVILKGEKLLALGKASEAEQGMTALYAAMPNHSAVVDLMMRIYQAENRIPESSALRIKLDDLRAKTSYWSSPEMLRSPFGPLALVK